MGTWTPPTQWWRRHIPWLVPFACLAVTVLILAVVWHRDAVEPEFPKLQIPQSLRSEQPSIGRETVDPQPATQR
jgi:hypothetical protein